MKVFAQTEVQLRRQVGRRMGVFVMEPRRVREEAPGIISQAVHCKLPEAPGGV